MHDSLSYLASIRNVRSVRDRARDRVLHRQFVAQSLLAARHPKRKTQKSSVDAPGFVTE